MSEVASRGSYGQYAEHIGASPAYVSKLKKQGRLVVVKDDAGRDVVDFAMSDRLVRNTTDMGRARNGANASPGRAPSVPLEPVSSGGRVDAIYRQAQAQERAYAAKMAEIDYKKAIGELVVAADVHAELARVFATVKEALLQIPARLSAVLAAESDQERVHETLQSEIHAALMHLKASM